MNFKKNWFRQPWHMLALAIALPMILLSMSALSADARIPRKEAGLQSYPVAGSSTQIYKGALVCLNSSGYLVAATDSSSVRFVGVAYENVLNSGSSGDKDCRVHTEGVFLLPATSITQAMVGQKMYVANDGAIDDTSTNLLCCGTLVGYVSTTSGWVDIGQRAGLATDKTVIVVSKAGDDSIGDGSWGNPVKSLTTALTLVTTSRKTIYIEAGTYSEAALLTWPNVNGLHIIGLGPVTISNADAAASVVKIDPTFTTATFEATLENVEIEHTAQIGLKIDNAGMGSRKLIVNLKRVSFSQTSTGNSITVAHTTVGQAIRLYAEDCREIEGLVSFTPGSGTSDDRVRMRNCDLIGGLTMVDVAVAAELTLLGCVVLTSTLTTGNAATVVNVAASVYRTDAGVYSTLTESLNG